MLRYIFHRILQLIPVLIGVVVIVFTINQFSKVSPSFVICGENASIEVIAAKEEELGLNKPYLVQLGTYFWNIISKGDLGTSYTKSIPVITLIKQRIGISAIIGLLGAVVACFIGVPLGLLGALKQNSPTDYLATGFTILCNAIPNFWLALLLMLLFSVHLKLTPIVGIETWRGYILPVATAAIPGVSLLARMTRSSVLENINADFVKTARAKGLPERTVVLKHIVRNSMIPVLTVIGSMIAHCVTGSVICETIFNVPGIGSLLNTSISGKDYITTQSCVLVCAAFISVANLVTDLFYAVIDPRIRAQYTKGSKKKTRPAKKKEANA